MKLKNTIFKLAPLVLTIGTIIPSSTGCSNNKTEIEKCNYTVKATVSADSNKISIAEGIKGWANGKLFVNILSDEKCSIDGRENLQGENVYVPK
jgi:hypothetical protein